MTPLTILSVVWLLTMSSAPPPVSSELDVARASAMALSGRVVTVATAWDADTIYTYVTIDVREVIEGWVPERRITLKQLGGRVGDTALVIDGQAVFDRNEEVFLFLSVRSRDRTLMTTALGRGKWSIVNGSNASDRRARRRS